MPEHSIRVGAGGQGAKAETPEDGGQSVTQRVEKIIEDHQQQAEKAESQETVLRERRADELPNPKKRMWEGPSGDAKGSVKAKDEL